MKQLYELTKYIFSSFNSYLTKPEDRQKHHIEVVEKEIHTHPDQYPKVHIKDHPSPQEQAEEVKEFDAAYKLPIEKPVINWL